MDHRGPLGQRVTVGQQADLETQAMMDNWEKKARLARAATKAHLDREVEMEIEVSLVNREQEAHQD